MGCQKSIFAVAYSIMIVAMGNLTLSLPAQAADGEERISMERSSPDKPIGRDGVLAKVKAEYKGRVLSIQEKPAPNFEDCHVVRMLTLEGEHLTIKVACPD